MTASPVVDTSLVNHQARSTRSIMRTVMAALIPGTLLYAWLIDARILLLLLTCVATAILVEAAALRLRHYSLKYSVTDGSAVLAAWLLALSLPPSLPLWQAALGAAIMILLGKQLFGGLGQNPFNPAMLGLAFLLVTFPTSMTDWPLLPGWDGMSGATPLDRWLSADQTTSGQRETWVVRAERTMHSPWPWVAVAWLMGGLWLVIKGMIDWRLPTAFLCSIMVLQIASTTFQGETLSLVTLVALPLSGALMLAAFFIVTDPVTAAASPRGRWIYASLAAFLTWLLREFSSYPEGVAFALLLANACVPLIDHLMVRGLSR